MSSNFEKAGVLLIASTGKSVKLEIHDPNRVFMDIYYVSIKDLEDVLNKRKETATVIKIREDGFCIKKELEL